MVSLIDDRFPGRQRKDRIPVPDDLLKEDLPLRENNIQEERRLFYVGMTRAKKSLYLSWGRDYGVKRLKKVSPFVLEALDLPKSPEGTLRTSVLEEIERYALLPAQPVVSTKVREQSPMRLSFFQVDDYLTCPLKYKYRHVMRIPVLPHHNLVYGRILHSMIHCYLKNRMAGKKISEKTFSEEFHVHWVNEGFLSREHEEMRKKEGEKALRTFFLREEASNRLPLYLEKSFRWQFNHIQFVGRWDRIDAIEDGAVIIDYKATSVKDQREADRKAQQSLQMDLYALSFVKTQDIPLVETRLHFLESDTVGRAKKGEKERARALDKIKEAEKGIRVQDFPARPDWHNCNLCDFKAICPDSFAY
ncbi:MAG: PD-(D/E)XK nuclease family protein, partial [Candidatus Aminicenantes bacterium]|nr:PD-(D/E)XK nuclease family protein [Candidatus Aminicenantes bacterium]